jgi:hypothetical protein
MRHRSLRMILWITGGAGLLAAAAVAWIGMTLPLAVTEAGARPRARQAAVTTRPAAGAAYERLDPAAINRLAAMDLRRPLYDPPPAQAAPQPAPVPLAVRLLGTAVEPGRSRALVVGPDGKVQLVSAGESVAGAEVRQIEAESITVRYRDEDVVVQLERSKVGG